MTSIDANEVKVSPARCKAALRRFVSDCSGASAIEYVVTGAIIGAGVLIGVGMLRAGVEDLYARVAAVFS